MFQRIAGAIVVGLMATGCQELLFPDVCQPHIAVNVSDGVHPIISWSPRCRVNGLSVRDSTDTVWFVFAPRGFGSPVTYGMVPDNARETGPGPLNSGGTYTVILEVDSETAVVVGSTTFVHK